MPPCRAFIRMAATAWVVLLAAAPAQALPDLLNICTARQLERLRAEMHGTLLDFTRNHGQDCRIWSQALCEKRDLYMYLPPGYDGITAYPVMIWMHGFGQDEKTFLDFAPVIDWGIRTGRFPPMVIAAPDGSIRGRPSLVNNGSFYLNSKAGRFEDYIVQDIWCFIQRNFRIRPEREAHVLAGGSMGGYGAFHIGFSHREHFGVLAGILPALDIRYADCHDRYFSKYDPNCVMERDHLRRQRVIGKFYGGLIMVRERRLTDPLLGRRPPDGLRSLAAHNPVEMLESCNIRPGEFAMFIGYAGRDEFNLGAQAEHFLDKARRRGIYPYTSYVAEGRHRTETGKMLIPELSQWLCTVLMPYVPPGTCGAFASPCGLLTSDPVKPRVMPLGMENEVGLWPRGAIMR